MPIKYSVIIPTLNQSAKLRICLANLADLDFDPDAFEVLVIDNDSTDDTKDVTEYHAAMVKNLRYHHCLEPGLMAARHMGCDESIGDILCYLDDDSLVTKEWLKGMADSFSREDVVIAGGPCIPKYERPPPDWIEYFWFETEYGKINGFLSLVDFGNEFKMVSPNYIYGCNYAIRKKIFIEYGGTHPDYYPDKYRAYQGNGESALAQNLQRNSFWAAYNPMAQVEHFIPCSRLTVDYFCWRRYFNGIHASFHDVRKQHGLDGYKVTVPIYFYLSNVILQSIRRPIGRLKRYILRLTRKAVLFSAIAPPEPDEVVEIKRKIEDSFHAGYFFHQESLKNDPKLLEWVLRPNYMGENGKLPL